MSSSGNPALLRTRRSDSSHRSSTTPLWDPRSTLHIASDNRCVGHISSTRRKCRVKLAAQNLRRANIILRYLSNQQPEFDAFPYYLHRLARLLLCPARHQAQAQGTVDEWEERIKDGYPVDNAEIEDWAMESMETVGMEAGYVYPTRSREIEEISPVRAMEMEAEHEQDARTHPYHIRSGTGTYSVVSPPAPMSSSPVPGTPDWIVEMQGFEERFQTMERRVTQLEHAARFFSASMTPTPLSRGYRRMSPISMPTPCPRLHVRRRAIDDECPICRVDFRHDDQLTWCKNRCGRTVHLLCFEGWEAACRDSGRMSTCALCRVRWGTECGCEH